MKACKDCGGPMVTCEGTPTKRHPTACRACGRKRAVEYTRRYRERRGRPGPDRRFRLRDLMRSLDDPYYLEERKVRWASHADSNEEILAADE